MPTKQKTNIATLTNLYRTLNYKFKKKQNIQQFLKKNKFTHDQIIKISYDIQSGTYINFYTKLSKKRINQIYYPLVDSINQEFLNCKTFLDFGCGELTSSKYIFKNLSNKIENYFATDISLNRLILGQKYLKKDLAKKDFNKIKIFCNSNLLLPFKNNSIDLVITSHALEPNNKNKDKIIKELIRVSKYGLVLMEPHYESADNLQKKRMNKFGYIKGLEKVFHKYKCSIKILKKQFHLNNLNKSSIFIIKKKQHLKQNNSYYVDPIDKSELKKINNFLYSKKNFRLYPEFNKISIFSDDSQFFLPKLKV